MLVIGIYVWVGWLGLVFWCAIFRVNCRLDRAHTILGTSLLGPSSHRGPAPGMPIPFQSALWLSGL
jgi:hypothetical protein